MIDNLATTKNAPPLEKAMIRVVLADDHALLRQGTASLLAAEKDVTVIAQASDGAEAVELARRMHPDVLVMDIRMPGMNGVQATRLIRDSLPDVRVLILTAYDEDQYVFSLLEAGASGYLLKTAPVNDLVRAVRQVAAGESPLSPAIAQKVVAKMQADSRGRKSDSNTGGDDLTPRELEVLQMLARGMSNQEIGRKLFISERTAQAHLTSIFAKLQVASRLDAVLKGIRRGILIIEPERDE